jgi:hypothetical protein
MTNTAGLIAADFLHHRNSNSYAADIGPETTGDHAIAGLIEAGFLDKGTGEGAYALQLVRTGATLVRGQALVAQGVAAGDRIQVVLPQKGGTPC